MEIVSDWQIIKYMEDRSNPKKDLLSCKRNTLKLKRIFTKILQMTELMMEQKLIDFFSDDKKQSNANGDLIDMY